MQDKKKSFFFHILKNMQSIFIFAFFCFPMFTQELSKPDAKDACWRYLQKASLAYKNGAYDECIVECQIAKENRTKEVEYEVAMLEKPLKVVEVIKKGDSLKEILPVLEKRKNTQTIEVIEKYMNLYGKDFFSDSMQKLLSYIRSKKNYPEVDFLLSKVYFLQGELSLSKQYLLLAFDNASVLEIPDEKYDILYDLAKLAFIDGDYDSYEKYLTLIIADDSVFWDSGLDVALLRTIDTNTPQAAQKFFTLYRANNNRCLKAYQMLSQIYEDLGNFEDALKTVAFAALTSYSKIFDVAKERNINFSYTNVQNLFKEASQYDDVVEWAEDNDVWESFYLLAEYAKQRGSTVFANALFDIIAQSFPEEYWRLKAENQLVATKKDE